MGRAADPAANDPLWVRAAWLLPLALFALFLRLPGQAGFALDWVPALGIEFAFRLDGLNRLFLLLITGVGALVFFYAPGYLRGDPRLPRLMSLLIAFMLAMIGAVGADDLLLLFLFWEATSVLSFLLVGFSHDRQDAREAARQALLITGGGGLALLGGILLILAAAPGLRLSDLHALDPALHADPRFTAGVALVLLGAMTKSAQFPFHYWLPGAMAAPTPVSAYLHSATMVKLGVYVMARFDEAMGGVGWWTHTLTVLGTVTAVWAAVQALRERDLKRILAWSTVSALGTLTLLIGLPNELGAVGFTAFLLAHALYKAPLFFVAGNVDHVAGTRIIDHLRGLRRAMPVTAAAAALAGISMAGLPSSFGFVAKDAAKSAKELAEGLWFVGGTSLLVSAVGVAVAAVAALRVFFGRPNDELCTTAHEEGLRLEAPPLILAATGILLGLWPALAEPLLLDAARMIAPQLGPADLMSDWASRLGTIAIILGVGAAIYLAWDRLHYWIEHLRWLDRVGPATAYPAGLAAIKAAASLVGRRIQDGDLGRYLAVTAAGAVIMVLPWLLPAVAGIRVVPGPHAAGLFAGCAVVVAGALLAVAGRDTLQRLLGAGAVGAGSALIFLFRGAPDLAFTQLAVETVFVVVAAVALRRYRAHAGPEDGRGFRAALAIAFGLTLGLLLLALMQQPPDPAMSRFFLENSVPQAQGRNVVNVIIVDFRALDTLGEIAVVLLAALAAWPLARALGRRGGGR